MFLRYYLDQNYLPILFGIAWFGFGSPMSKTSDLLSVADRHPIALLTLELKILRCE
jgi:hypothetical protein